MYFVVTVVIFKPQKALRRSTAKVLDSNMYFCTEGFGLCPANLDSFRLLRWIEDEGLIFL